MHGKKRITLAYLRQNETQKDRNKQIYKQTNN